MPPFSYYWQLKLSRGFFFSEVPDPEHRVFAVDVLIYGEKTRLDFLRPNLSVAGTLHRILLAWPTWENNSALPFR